MSNKPKLDPLKLIHQDHVNLTRILDLVEKEIDRARREEMPDLELLEDAMRYMVNYSDLMHHPMEDSMFALLTEKEPEVSERVDELRREHARLADLSGAFLEIVKAAQSGEFILRKEVVERGAEYVATLRAHMNTEEADLLKRARASLSEQDLEAIAEQYSGIRDPLLDESLREQYGNLYRSLFG